VTNYHAKCDGGPFHQRSLCHGTPVYPLFYEPRSVGPRCYPGMVSTTDPHIARGAYLFDEAAQIWRWQTEWFGSDANFGVHKLA